MAARNLTFSKGADKKPKGKALLGAGALMKQSAQAARAEIAPAAAEYRKAWPNWQAAAGAIKSKYGATVDELAWRQARTENAGKTPIRNARGHVSGTAF